MDDDRDDDRYSVDWSEWEPSGEDGAYTTYDFDNQDDLDDFLDYLAENGDGVGFVAAYGDHEGYEDDDGDGTGWLNVSGSSWLDDLTYDTSLFNSVDTYRVFVKG